MKAVMDKTDRLLDEQGGQQAREKLRAAKDALKPTFEAVRQMIAEHLNNKLKPLRQEIAEDLNEMISWLDNLKDQKQ